MEMHEKNGLVNQYYPQIKGKNNVYQRLKIKNEKNRKHEKRYKYLLDLS